jgi:hypothetical protein
MTFQGQFHARFGGLLAIGATVVALGAGTGAQAQSVFGSAGIITQRACNAASTATDCVVTSSKTTNFVGGGMSSGVAASFSNAAKSGALEAAFGTGYLPQLRVASSSVGDTRDGTTVMAFRSFTYTGTQDIDFALNGALHYVNSGDTHPFVGGSDQGNGYGDGELNVILGLFSIDVVAGLSPNTPGSDLFGTPMGDPECDNGAVAGASYNAFGQGAGEHLATISLTQTCSGHAITLHNGDQFVVAAVMQAFSNRTGFIDAMHTFTVELDPEHTYLAGTQTLVDPGVLAQSLNGAVPEPATWGSMILGFGAVGAMIRGRRRRALAAA